MVNIEIAEAAHIKPDEVVRLYESVGWTAYTRDPENLMRSVAGSHRVVTARRDGRLVGLARSISDGATIVYLQDVLVHPAEQGQGVGRGLMDALFDSYAHVRQHVLLTDTDPGQRAFYERLGFTEAHDHSPQLRAFVRMR